MLFCVTWNACSSAVATFWDALSGGCPSAPSTRALTRPMYCTVESPPPAAVTTREISLSVTEEAAGKVKLDPPLNSWEKFSPLDSSASTLTSRMRPEIGTTAAGGRRS